MSTRLELITAIKRESRIKNSTNLDPMVLDILNDVTRDYCNRAFNYELLQRDVAITLVDATGQYDLPADFFSLKGIRYGITSSSNNAYRELKPRTNLIKRTSSTGYPFFYELSAGPKINIFPYDYISALDSLLLDYYADPISVFDADGSNFPVPRLEAAVKKEVIMRIDKFHADTQAAQMDSSDANSSFTASQAAK